MTQTEATERKGQSVRESRWQSGTSGHYRTRQTEASNAVAGSDWHRAPFLARPRQQSHLLRALSAKGQQRKPPSAFSHWHLTDEHSGPGQPSPLRAKNRSFCQGSFQQASATAHLQQKARFTKLCSAQDTTRELTAKAPHGVVLGNDQQI